MALQPRGSGKETQNQQAKGDCEKLPQDAEDGDKEMKMEKEEEKCGGQETDHQHPRRL